MASTAFSGGSGINQGTAPGDKDFSNASSTSEEWTKVVTRGAAARAKHTSGTSVTNAASAFETVKWAKFHIFQAQVFPILSKLFSENPSTDTPFKKAWSKAIESRDPVLSGHTSWRNMQKLFKFKDYCTFIETCHGILPTISSCTIVSVPQLV